MVALNRRLLVVAALTAAVAVPTVRGAEAAPTCAPAGPEVTGGEWRTYGQDLANSRTQPSEAVIGTSNVGQLGLL